MTNVIGEKYAVIGEFDYDALIAGEQEPIIAKGVTLAAGQGVLARGTLLGIQTTGGLAVVCDSTEDDGSQVPAYILAETKDTGASGATLTVPALAYQTGIFNRAAITCKAGQTIDTFEAQLRDVGILLRSTMDNPTTAVTGVTLDKATLALTVGGDTGTLTPTIAPANATDKRVTWSSSAAAKATVSAAGVVTAVAAGEAVITCTTVDGGFTAKCTVTVTV